MKTLPTLSLASALTLSALTLSWATMSGCQTAQAAVDTVSGVAADALLPPSEEEKLGEQLAKEIDAELKMHPDDEVQRYVDRLGNRLVRAARARGEVPEGIDFEFHVIDDDKQIVQMKEEYLKNKVKESVGKALMEYMNSDSEEEKVIHELLDKFYWDDGNE